MTRSQIDAELLVSVLVFMGGIVLPLQVWRKSLMRRNGASWTGANHAHYRFHRDQHCTDEGKGTPNHTWSAEKAKNCNVFRRFRHFLLVAAAQNLTSHSVTHPNPYVRAWVGE